MAGTAMPIEVLHARGAWRSRTPSPVSDAFGEHVADLSLSPVPLIARTMSALRSASAPSTAALAEVLPRAARLFAGDGELGPLAAHEERVSRTSGLGISTVRSTSERIASGLERAADVAGRARPASTVESWGAGDAAAGGPRWVRRGSVLTVLTAGNHPGTHLGWLQAVALGYRVAVRPSRKEPFTPHRIVAALRTAGLPDNCLALLPCEYEGADEAARGADLTMVYGGDDVVRRYAGSRQVLPQGPGRSKVLVTRDAAPDRAVALATESIVAGGGTSCTNATAVLVEGDARAFAAALAERLAAIAPAEPTDPAAVLPVVPADAAARWEASLRRIAGDAERFGPATLPAPVGAAAALRPAVHLLPAALDERRNIELPFPNAWVVPWTRTDGAAPLRDTLVLTALTDDEVLLDDLLDEPTIRNVYAGAVPTVWTAPGVPHDGFLADFLMESKGVRRVA